jgi:hypothetical protein
MSARLEGDELFHQSQKAGLGKLFLIFTRPVLMVLGVIASFVLFMAFSYFLAMTFVGVANVNEGLVNDYGILSGIVSLLIFSYLVWYGATRCLSLINTLPQKVGEWMGLGVSDSQGEDRDVQNVQGAIVGYAGARGVQAVSGPAGAAANRAERAASKLPSAKGSSTKVTPDN